MLLYDFDEGQAVLECDQGAFIFIFFDDLKDAVHFEMRDNKKLVAFDCECDVLTDGISDSMMFEVKGVKYSLDHILQDAKEAYTEFCHEQEVDAQQEQRHIETLRY